MYARGDGGGGAPDITRPTRTIRRNLLVVQIKKAALSSRKLRRDSARDHLSSPLLRNYRLIHQNEIPNDDKCRFGQ
jgi:hypothetical protein